MAPSIAAGVSEASDLRAPFPWFGGKRRVASLVWSRLGNVDTYNEPFFGAGSVLLGRPHTPRVETVNDLDCFLANFWRALQHDPASVAYWADGPVNEADLHARHRWLVIRGRRLVLRCARDPHYFNAKVAGWWVWGQCLWIGSGWCQVGSSTRRSNEQVPKRPSDHDRAQLRHANGADADRIVEWKIRPDLSAANGRGGVLSEQRSAATRSGENPSEQRKRPHLTDDRGVHVARKQPLATGNGQGCGVHRQFDRNARVTVHQKPQLTGDQGVIGTAGQHRRPHLLRDKGVAARRWQGGGQGGGSGVHAPRLHQQKPDLSGDSATGRGIHASGFELRTGGLYDYLEQLAARLRRVRVCCGDWKRVLTPSVTTYIGLTGVFLDPPYQHDLRERCYSEDHDISAEVRAWALEHGENPNMRIALCGYEDEHGPHMPDTWEKVAWKAHGGYSRTERGVANRDQERIWFSPHCLKAELPLFAGVAS